MADIFWQHHTLERQLSAHLDGELPADIADALNERLALDPRALAVLQTLSRVDRLTRLAVTPEARPDLDATIAGLQRRVAAHRVAAAASGTAAAATGGWKQLTPALLASAGLLVTASIAFLGLRRRGLV